jgi:hypothetical protein
MFVVARIHHWRRYLTAAPSMVIALQLTALFLLLRGLGPYRPLYFDAPVALVGMALLVRRTLLLHPAPWFALSAYVMTLNLVYFHLSANHFYLFAYWLLACGLALSTKQPEALLRTNGRLLLGLAFCFATLWKIVGGEYLDGSFFHYSLITRFTDADNARIAGHVLGIEHWSENLRLRSELLSGHDPAASVVLSTSAPARYAAHALSAWTLLLEGAIGVTFVVVGSRLAGAVRDSLLLIFVATTFLIIPIDRFAIILTILGLAQCPDDRPRTRAAYLVLFAAMHLVRFVPMILAGR